MVHAAGIWSGQPEFGADLFIHHGRWDEEFFYSLNHAVNFFSIKKVGAEIYIIFRKKDLSKICYFLFKMFLIAPVPLTPAFINVTRKNNANSGPIRYVLP